MATRKWCIRFDYIIGVSPCEGEWITEDGDPLPLVVQAELWKMFPQATEENTALDLVMDCQSRGYYDGGSMYGGSDQVGWPPEGEDERTPLKVEVRYGNKWHKLSHDSLIALFDVNETAIYNFDLDTYS